MDTDMRGDMVSLDGGRTTTTPLAGQIEVVGALTANMALTHMFLHLLVYAYRRTIRKETHVKRFRCRRLLSAPLPQTRQLLTRPCSGSGSSSRVIVLVHGSGSTHGRGRRRRRSGDRRRRRRGRDSGLLVLLRGHDMRLLRLWLSLLLLLLLVFRWQMGRSVGGSSSHGGHGSVLLKFRHCQDQQVFLSVSWEQRNQPSRGNGGDRREEKGE